MISHPAQKGKDARKQEHLNAIMREVVVPCFTPVSIHAQSPTQTGLQYRFYAILFWQVDIHRLHTQ